MLMFFDIRVLVLKLIWVVTFLATVILDVDYGLSVGFVFSILTIVLRTQSPHCALLGRIPHTDIYKDVLVYQDVWWWNMDVLK